MAAKLELLAPAGNWEKAQVAMAYGADAIYVGGKAYNLRAAAGNFSLSELEQLVIEAHKVGVKVYVTVNIIAHNRDLEGLPDYVQAVSESGADAIIFADPAVFTIAREVAPHLPLHISTQASLTNWRAVKFWEELGVQRVILARELSLREIREIRDRVSLELEGFVHGAMCISYSGRCLLSNYLTGRDANRGECAQPCRWQYYLMEETRPRQYFPIMEDARGTYILNSGDLNMIAHIPDLAAAGLNSLKIEGRMKSVHYVATVVRAYRAALDFFHSDPDNWQVQTEWQAELNKVSHRPYGTGFYYHRPGPEGQVYESAAYERTYDFVGVVQGEGKQETVVEVRNRIQKGEIVELMTPRGPVVTFPVEAILTEQGEPVHEAHPNQVVEVPLPVSAPRWSLLRRRVKE